MEENFGAQSDAWRMKGRERSRLIEESAKPSLHHEPLYDMLKVRGALSTANILII